MPPPPKKPPVEAMDPSAAGSPGPNGLVLLKQLGLQLPEKPGVYLFKNHRDEVVYVGKAKRLKRRVLSYLRLDQLPLRKQRMIINLGGIDTVVTTTETEALLLEANLIKKHRPPCNIILKDDKSFPYLHLTDGHPFPQLKIHRGKRTDKGKYFGPFPGKHVVYETYETLQQLSLVRTCEDSVFNNRTRPCLLYDIKRCSAPCVGKISPSAYQELLQQMIRFFKGQTHHIQEILAQHMRQASNERAYETAMVLRDRIKALTKSQERQAVHLPGREDIHVHTLVRQGGKVCIGVGFYQSGQYLGCRAYFPGHIHDDDANGDILATFLSQFYEGHPPAPTILTNLQPSHASLLADGLRHHLGRRVRVMVPQTGPKKDALSLVENSTIQALEQHLTSYENHQQGLESLGTLLGISTPIKRVESYDNSHLFGENAYGVMVVADEEGLAKHAYRRFAMKDPSLKTNDDFAMMRHIMERRFLGSTSSDTWPCVLLIDGGIGQLNAVKAFFDNVAKEGEGLVGNLAASPPRMVGIAKGPHRNAGEETLHLDTGKVVKLDKGDPLLHFLQRLRDEAHRFAITAHRSKREKKLRRSILDDIPGIGPKRKKALLNHFGSAHDVAQASLTSLQCVEGINAATANQLYAWFRK